jgi:hypothetical protein
VNSNPSSHNAASPSKLAVILPSRGLMFSETFEELLNELEDFDYEIFWAHGRPLPDCFNEPLERVLADPTVFAVLFCEDDMIIPKGILQKMFGQTIRPSRLIIPLEITATRRCYTIRPAM